MNGAPWGPPDPTNVGPSPEPPQWTAALRARRPPDDEPVTPSPSSRAGVRPSPVVLGWLAVAGIGALVFGVGLPRLAAWERGRGRAEPLAAVELPSERDTPTSTTSPPPSLAPPVTSSAEDRALTQAFVARIGHLELDPLTASAAGRALCASLTQTGGDVAAARASGSVLASSGSLADAHLAEVFGTAVEVFCPEWTAVWAAG